MSVAGQREVAAFRIPVVETERLRLRAPCQSDLPAWTAYFAHPRSAFVGGPLNNQEAWRSLASEIGHWGLKGFGRWAVEIRETGDFAGIVGCWQPEGFDEPELAWDLVDDRFEGKGYATEAARAARDYAYGTLGWTTLASHIADRNLVSIPLAQRLGATPERSFTHSRMGEVTLWRHPGPEEAA